MKTKRVPFALGHDDKIWIEKILEVCEAGKKTTYRQLRVELNSKVSKGYTPNHLCPVIYRYQDVLTLTGIFIYNPKNAFVGRTDKIWKEIRSRFIEDTFLKRVTAESLASSCNIAHMHVERCLTFLYNLDIFAAGSNQGEVGIRNLDFGTDEKNIEAILKYENVEQLVQNDMLRYNIEPKISELDLERNSRKRAERLTFIIGITSILATIVSPLIDKYFKPETEKIEITNDSLIVSQNKIEIKLDSINEYLKGIEIKKDSVNSPKLRSINHKTESQKHH